jgi:nucleoside-diphosphate-sugar epimerase
VEPPGMIVTGGTGFLGRHLLETFKDAFRISTLSRGSPGLHGVSLPAGVRWYPVDIARAGELDEVFDAIARTGPVEIVVHLAGHYDFTGEANPEYQRTNVEGMRNVLDASRRLGVRDVVFSSSVAACAFPAGGGVLDEESPADGDTPYAASKRAGEAMLAACGGAFRAWTIRFGAIYSDWGEYEPLFRFIEMWLSRSPRRRVLAGHGRFALPYLHIRDAVGFVRTLVARRDALEPGGVLIASPDGATTHRDLFEAATAAHFGERVRPLFLPRSLSRAGLNLLHAAGRAVGRPPFERPWMGRFIDHRMAVDARRTRARLDWSPRARLSILRRMPFLIQNRKSSIVEWQRRNSVALRSARGHDNLRIHRLLAGQRGALARGLADYVLDPQRSRRFPGMGGLGRDWHDSETNVLLESLIEAVRTGEQAIFRGACRDLARRMRDGGIPSEEVAALLDALGDQCVLALAGETPGRAWSMALYDHVTMTVQFGIDEVQETFEGG